MGKLFSQVKQLWDPLGINQKISIALAAGLVVLAMIAMMVWSAQPKMQLLYGGLSAEEAGKIVSKLEQKGVPFEAGRGGDSIYVEAGMVHRLRMELATEGIPAGSGPGFEIFDESGLGISDFQQRTNFLRAVQGELARTISQFDGVNSARVMVVMPENRIVVSREGRDRPTASVFVDTPNGLPLPAVNSIRHVVANAIQGLKVDDVVVVDSSGVVLSEELKGDGLNTGLSNDVIRYRKGLETYFTAKVQSMLDRALGPGQSEVRVAVDVDTSSVQTTEKSFDPDSQVVRGSTTTETIQTEAEVAAPGSAVGAASNLPQSEGQGESDRSSSREERTESRTERYEISEVTRSSVQAPGSIRRLTASVLVAKRYVGEGGERAHEPRTPEELQSLRRSVVNALGISLAPGQNYEDLVSITEMDFATAPRVEQAQMLQKDGVVEYWMELGKPAVALLLGIGVIIFFLQMLKRNKPEEISFELMQPEEMLQSRKMEDTSAVTPEMLNELIRQKPANIGVSLKEWLGDVEPSK